MPLYPIDKLVMSVLLDTSAGEIVIDLFTGDDDAPIASLNFLKLCKMKFFNNCLFFNIQPNLIAQTGDPTGSGKGGTSIFGLLEKNPRKSFKDEIPGPPFKRKFDKVGVVAMANTGENSNRSQFFITLRGDELAHFDGKYTIFGEVAEGFEVLEKLNGLYCDEDGRPYQDVRIRLSRISSRPFFLLNYAYFFRCFMMSRHTFILDDPFPDPSGLTCPDASPLTLRPTEETVAVRNFINFVKSYRLSFLFLKYICNLIILLLSNRSFTSVVLLTKMVLKSQQPDSVRRNWRRAYAEKKPSREPLCLR
jgi:peptidyl-prolyl cis-trans isomerase-like 4